jgi:hypothetical protein
MEKPTTQQRYYFIEMLAYWEGHINTKDLDRQFGLSRQQSSAERICGATTTFR